MNSDGPRGLGRNSKGITAHGASSCWGGTTCLELIEWMPTRHCRMRLATIFTAVLLGLPVFGLESPGTQSSAEQSTNQRFTKIVAMVPVRDEAHLLPSSLRALSRIADAIVVLDDCSSDGSGEMARSLAQECKVELVVRTPSCTEQGEDRLREARVGSAMPYWGDEVAHRSFLLKLGREVGGTHFWAIDADEVVVVGQGAPDETAELLQVFRGLLPGDLLVLPYITMYNSATTYRSDKADKKPVGFVDQLGASFHRRSRDDRLHTPRLPYIPQPGNAYEFRVNKDDAPHTAVLHFGFSNLANARMKNVIYNMFDIVTGSPKQVEEMNNGLEAQGLTRDAESNIKQHHLAPVPQAWTACLAQYEFEHAPFETCPAAQWREKLALEWLLEGPVRFRGMLALDLLGLHAFTDVPKYEVPRFLRLLSRLSTGS